MILEQPHYVILEQPRCVILEDPVEKLPTGKNTLPLLRVYLLCPFSFSFGAQKGRVFRETCVVIEMCTETARASAILVGEATKRAATECPTIIIIIAF